MRRRIEKLVNSPMIFNGPLHSYVTHIKCCTVYILIVYRIVQPLPSNLVSTWSFLFAVGVALDVIGRGLCSYFIIPTLGDIATFHHPSTPRATSVANGN
jgi:hypothetical protein